MEELNRIRSASLWIFIIPLVAINSCLFISINYHLFENTIFVVDQIGRSGFTIPYIDGSLSISRAARTYPSYLLFKPSMIITAIILIQYWISNNNLFKKIEDINDKNKLFLFFGVGSALFLISHSIFSCWKKTKRAEKKVPTKSVRMIESTSYLTFKTANRDIIPAIPLSNKRLPKKINDPSKVKWRPMSVKNRVIALMSSAGLSNKKSVTGATAITARPFSTACAPASRISHTKCHGYWRKKVKNRVGNDLISRLVRLS